MNLIQLLKIDKFDFNRKVKIVRHTKEDKVSVEVNDLNCYCLMETIYGENV